MTEREEFEAWLNSPAGNTGLMIWDVLDAKINADAWLAWQAAKESSRKELEEKDRRIAELLSGCTRSHPHELMNPMCELRTDVARLTNHLATCQAEKEALDKAAELRFTTQSPESDIDQLTRRT